ncbi:DivIVA domain-containing protein [Micromonospora pisi]|uniref:DivIVA domain-containing protein n=1 Tax=Micromonospora pisi TaxID=589240 RepID=A0A495JIK2_9ACTN|nr:DivIVA domain-containing protein [Micromonospora pisi]RKR88747.1 DivIVA domain-containing protein [Micromonospora pisi]
MGQFLLLLVVALTAAAVVFGVTVLLTGGDPGMVQAEPDGRAVPLPTSRPLAESDVSELRFDTALRGYRMSQVDQAFQRAAYDIGYKDELIGVLEAEVEALREGRNADADALRQARVAALAPGHPSTAGEAPDPAGTDDAGVAAASEPPTASGPAAPAPAPAAAVDLTPAVPATTTQAPKTSPEPAGEADPEEAPASVPADSGGGPALRTERG